MRHDSRIAGLTLLFGNVNSVLGPSFDEDMVAIAKYKNCRAYIDDLAERMARYGITQAQLGEELGLLAPQLSRWFREGDGGVRPSADYIFKIERCFQKLKRQKIAEKMRA